MGGSAAAPERPRRGRAAGTILLQGDVWEFSKQDTAKSGC